MNFLRTNFFKKHSFRIILGTILILAIASAFVWYVVISEKRGDILTVAFLDIGQGDSIFIEAPNGNQIIFDGGPNGKILNELGNVMPFYDKTIDMIVVTNPDKDHFAGFLDLLGRYKVEKFMEPGTKAGSGLYRDLENAVEAQGAEKFLARRGMKIELDREHGVYVDILFPDGEASALKTNDGSIIARLVYRDTSVMLTGDAPQKTENYVMALDALGVGGKGNGQSDQKINNASSTSTTKERGLKSDVLKTGHHGSKTSTGENFVGKVAPKFAVISDGKNNKYGHPNIETLDTLEKFKVKVFRTDQLGTIIMKSNGHTIDLAH